MKQTNGANKSKERRRLYFTLIVTKNDKTITRYRTHSLRCFKRSLRMINWEDGPTNVYIKVSEGLLLDCWGKMSRFFNDDNCDNPDDLWMSFNSFIE
jgi:hypothetical protein